jgi:hypothetical protein
MRFDETHRTVTVQHAVVRGPDVDKVKEWIKSIEQPGPRPHIFIEKYAPRQRLNTDERMVKADAAFLIGLRGCKMIRNTGSKQVVKQELMQLLGVWQFSTPTHHQDLRSAARIGLFGMMKDPPLNAWLADVVRDTLDGNPWEVR